MLRRPETGRRRWLEYLAESETRVTWTDVSDLAQHFQTVRDATRAAMRLPSRFRAFALPVCSAVEA